MLREFTDQNSPATVVISCGTKKIEKLTINGNLERAKPCKKSKCELSGGVTGKVVNKVIRIKRKVLREVKHFTHCSLLVSFCSLLVSFCS